ncbi:2936_t:CDS:1 [Paraglomus brasilianum]|uniref:2936_t:CDS:1 n=1 Tax=Paraglomus brasilianum TaxID=144538 RepID=A0A9N8VYL5_9GLOM|nr:2936_t:CDS:1 [Paraglomus brasilianum]
MLDIEGLNRFKTKHLKNPHLARSTIETLQKKARYALENPHPYSVINSSITAPNGNKHEFYSLAAYWWPNCKGIENVQDPDKECPYVRKDGQWVPDIKKATDPDDFNEMTADVTTLAVAYTIFGDEKYAEKAAHLLNTWFLNPDTYMKPSVNFGQVIRGRNHNNQGRSEGILELRTLVYIPQALALIEKSQNVGTNLTSSLKSWFNQYSTWLVTSSLGVKERRHPNNHGTFYIAQTATCLHFAGRNAEARNLINAFADGYFKAQINKEGKQPLEVARTKVYHYECFNLIALVYIARLSIKLDATNLWETQTKYGVTIKAAVDRLVQVTNELLDDMKVGKELKEKLYAFRTPLYAARDYYGDPDGEYGALLGKLLELPGGPIEYWTLWSPYTLEGLSDDTYETYAEEWNLIADSIVDENNTDTYSTSVENRSGISPVVMLNGGILAAIFMVWLSRKQKKRSLVRLLAIMACLCVVAAFYHLILNGM